MLMGLGTLWDLNLTPEGRGTVLEFTMAVKGLGLLWDLDITFFWMPLADAGARETNRQSIYIHKTKPHFPDNLHHPEHDFIYLHQGFKKHNGEVKIKKLFW